MIASGAGVQAAVSARGCCCCGGLCDCPKDFQKVLELRDVGLVVYRHVARTEERNKITGMLESATKTTEDVFILLNTKGSELRTAQYLPGIERTKISCPRCRQLAAQLVELLQRAPDVERGAHVGGICKRCLMRDKPCHNCDNILNKFMSNRREVSEETKLLIRQWLSRIQHILDGITGVDDRRHGAGAGAGAGASAGAGGIVSGRIRANSELNIDQVLTRTGQDTRQLDVTPMFRPRTIKLYDRGHFMEDRSRFHDGEISKIFGETMSRQREREREYEREHDLDGGVRRWQYDEPTSSRAAVPTATRTGLWTRRSISEESIPSFAKASKSEAARRARAYGESYKFREGEYRRRSESRDFIEPDDIKSDRYRDHGRLSETYARGDAHYRDLKTVRSKSIGPTRKGTTVDMSADSILTQRDYRRYNEVEARSKAKREDKDVYYRRKEEDKDVYYRRKKDDKEKKSATVELRKGERPESKKDQREYDSKERKKKEKVEQKQRDKDQTTRTKTDKRELVQQDQNILKSEKAKSAKDKSVQDQKQKKEKDLSIKDKGEKEQKEKELSIKQKGGQEHKQRGAKEFNTKDKGGQDHKQRGEKEFSTKSRQEPKQKVERDFSTKDKGGQEPKQKDKTTQVPTLKGEKSTKDQGGQEQKPKGVKESGTKDKSGQELKQKGEKELSMKDKGEHESKQKGEKELSMKDKGEQEVKQKRTELSKTDKTEHEPKQKGEKELSTKEKGKQELEQKGEKELSTKDKGGQEQKTKGEKQLSTKDKDEHEPKQNGEIELSTKDTGEQDRKQKGGKELSTEDKDKSGPKQKTKGEKESVGKYKGEQELKQKDEKALSTKDKSGQEQKEKSEKESDLKNKDAPDKKKKGKIEEDKKVPYKINKDDKAADTKKKEKGEKDGDAKDTHDKETKQEEEGKGKKNKLDSITIIMEQRKKDPIFRDFTGPKERGERRKGMKDEGEVDNKTDKKTGKRGKGKKTDKKQEESNKGEEKKDQEKPKESILEEKELPPHKIRMRRASPDDLILKLVKLKQTVAMPQRTDIDIEVKNINQIIRDHFAQKHEFNVYAEVCPFCRDSDYGLDMLGRPKEPELAEVIIGSKVYKYKPPLSPSIKNPEGYREDTQVAPVHFQMTYVAENIVQTLPQKEEAPPPEPPAPPVEDKKNNSKLTKKGGKQSKPPETEPINTKGIMNFKLSDRSFIEKGWTKLPTEKVVRKMNVYRMRPAHPEFDWFAHNKRKRLMTYESGERLAEFDEAGRGRWYYRNGRLALDYYDAEGLNAQQRVVIWSSGEPDERGRARPYTVLATFDYLGNGIVFDHTGKIRMKYNQTEGIVLDRSIGPVSHWKWHSLNDPPVLAQVMIETQEAGHDPRLAALGAGAADGRCAAADRPPRPDNDEMLAIEFDNFVRAKGEKLTRAFKPFQIKMKALKVNEYFSLKVLDQATVYLIYRDGRTNLKLNLGMVVDHHEIVDTDNAEVGEVSSEVERRPARSESLAALQRGVLAAQRWGRRRAARDARLRPAPPPAPAAVTSRPPALALDTAPALCRCARKPQGPNLYYDNRIF